MAHYIDEMLADVDEFLKTVEKDVKLAKAIRSTVLRLKFLGGDFADRRKNGVPFCEVDGCIRTTLYEDRYCVPHMRRANRENY